MNSVSLLGRLTRDPEISYSRSDTNICKFTLAIDRPVRQGEEKQADFIRITVFGRQADACGRYLSKGRQAAVQGRLQTSTYKDRNGENRSVTDVIAEKVEFIGSAEKTSPRSSSGQIEASADQRPPADTRPEPRYEQQRMSYEDDLPSSFTATTDDIPF